MGAPILVEVSEGFSSPIDIALKELEASILPITIRRTLPDGTYQDISLKWLLAEEQTFSKSRLSIKNNNKRY